jgi:hypothetical protein
VPPGRVVRAKVGSAACAAAFCSSVSSMMTMSFVVARFRIDEVGAPTDQKPASMSPLASASAVSLKFRRCSSMSS